MSLVDSHKRRAHPALLLAGALALAWAATCAAHVASNSFISARVTGTRVEGAVAIALRDVELAIGVDENHDGKVTWGELRASQTRIADYLRANSYVKSGESPCTLAFGPLAVDDRVDGAYAWLPFDARCPSDIRELRIGYSVLHGIDPSHRGLLSLTFGTLTRTGVLGGSASESVFEIASPSRWQSFSEYLGAGVGHILSGFDHLLFLLTLLLPAVLKRENGAWLPLSSLRPALINTLAVVSSFTLAHSLTLTLAALDWVRLPSRVTESVIAASIVVAALNNVFPWVTEHRARIAFGFGLLHGFGFASVLSDMGLPTDARLVSLVAFNAGIEIGQVAVVLAVMPVIYAARSIAIYRRAVMPWGSAAIAALALVWLVQRASG